MIPSNHVDDCDRVLRTNCCCPSSSIFDVFLDILSAVDTCIEAHKTKVKLWHATQFSPGWTLTEADSPAILSTLARFGLNVSLVGVLVANVSISIHVIRTFMIWNAPAMLWFPVITTSAVVVTDSEPPDALDLGEIWK